LSHIEGGLPERRRAHARFFTSFALFQLDQLDEAEHRLAALNREYPTDTDVAYLLAYLRGDRHDSDGAEPVLAALGPADRQDDGKPPRSPGLFTTRPAHDSHQPAELPLRQTS
jgi:hypothetical protein